MHDAKLYYVLERLQRCSFSFLYFSCNFAMQQSKTICKKVMLKLPYMLEWVEKCSLFFSFLFNCLFILFIAMQEGHTKVHLHQKNIYKIAPKKVQNAKISYMP